MKKNCSNLNFCSFLGQILKRKHCFFFFPSLKNCIFLCKKVKKNFKHKMYINFFHLILENYKIQILFETTKLFFNKIGLKNQSNFNITQFFFVFNLDFLTCFSFLKQILKKSLFLILPMAQKLFFHVKK